MGIFLRFPVLLLFSLGFRVSLSRIALAEQSQEAISLHLFTFWGLSCKLSQSHTSREMKKKTSPSVLTLYLIETKTKYGFFEKKNAIKTIWLLRKKGREQKKHVDQRIISKYFQAKKSYDCFYNIGFFRKISLVERPMAPNKTIKYRGRYGYYGRQ